MVVKIMYKLYAKEGMGREEFVDVWLKTIVPLSKQAPGVKKWVVNAVVSAQGEDPGYQGSGEIWFDSMKELQAFLAFVNERRSSAPNFTRKETIMIVEEHVIV